MTSRRRFVGTVLAGTLLLPARSRGEVVYPAVVPRPLAFPRDHGSHPAFRTEWWYITGWLRDDASAAGARDRGQARAAPDDPSAVAHDGDFGVQVTFFRHRPGIAEDSASRFAPRQLLFAHAAIADPALARLRHDQRAAREGFGIVQASEHDTDVAIGDWWLRRNSDDTYATQVVARDFAFTLEFTPRAPLLLQGDAGTSRKGPRAAQASYYYSRPQLGATGTVTVGKMVRKVTGTAWLDHEWSSEYLAAEARGWDWTGINLDDGGALMAFVIRDRQGGAYWAGGTWRDAAGRVTPLGPDDVQFAPQRPWRSPQTGVEYPVAMRLRVGAVAIDLMPLFDDQELDSRASVGTIYWEGAVRAVRDGKPVGRGYLELTGYGGALRI